MGFQDVFKKSFLEGFSGMDITTGKIAATLFVTALLALYVFMIYRLVTRKVFYSKNFNISLAAMSLITAAIILAMQSNLVISLGMVGALSIVRFRTAVKEPLDLAFLFWAIAVGIVLAAGMIPLAVFGSLAVGLTLLVLANRKPHANPYIVVLQCDGHGSESVARTYLEEHTRRCVVKSKTARKDRVELNLEVRLKDGGTDFVNALAELPGVDNAVLVSYNGDYMG